MKILKEFNCIVGVIEGKLQMCEIIDGSPIFWAGSLGWKDIAVPVDPKFIEAANAALGTHFKSEDF